MFKSFTYLGNKVCAENVILKVMLGFLFCVLESQPEAPKPDALDLWQAGISHYKKRSLYVRMFYTLVVGVRQKVVLY